MRVKLRYENTWTTSPGGQGEGEDTAPDRDLVIRITLSEKQTATMTGRKLLETFGKQYNRKFDEHFNVDNHFVQIAHGKCLKMDDLLADFAEDDAELFIGEVGKELIISSAREERTDNQKACDTAQAADSGSKPSSCPEKIEREAAAASGKVRCKNFGCNMWYDPLNNTDPTACRHHKAPPIFHETAKWWSCCPNTKAYDWDEFQKIPGCQTGVHCDVAAKKQVLGGVDLRASSAPQRIDGGEEVMDPRKKLEMLRKAMLTIGVEEDFFDKAWGRLAAKHGNLDTVVTVLKLACEESLTKATSGEIAIQNKLNDMD